MRALVPHNYIVREVSVGRADDVTMTSSTGVYLVVAALILNVFSAICVLLGWLSTKKSKNKEGQ